MLDAKSHDGELKRWEVIKRISDCLRKLLRSLRTEVEGELDRNVVTLQAGDRSRRHAARRAGQMVKRGRTASGLDARVGGNAFAVDVEEDGGAFIHRGDRIGL